MGARGTPPTLPGPEERLVVWPRCEAASWEAKAGGVLGRLGSPGSASSSITELSSMSVRDDDGLLCLVQVMERMVKSLCDG